MTEEVWQEVIDEAKRQIGSLLDDNAEPLYDAYEKSIHECALNEKPLKYGVGITIHLAPVQSGARVSTKLGYAVKHVDESEPREIDPENGQPGLFDEQGKGTPANPGENEVIDAEFEAANALPEGRPVLQLTAGEPEPDNQSENESEGEDEQ